MSLEILLMSLSSVVEVLSMVTSRSDTLRNTTQWPIAAITIKARVGRCGRTFTQNGQKKVRPPQKYVDSSFKQHEMA